MKLISNILRDARKSAGMTQLRLGTMLRQPLDNSVLARFEAGSRVPTPAHVLEIGDALGGELNVREALEATLRERHPMIEAAGWTIRVEDKSP